MLEFAANRAADAGLQEALAAECLGVIFFGEENPFTAAAPSRRLNAA
jgi:hypothetical protein